MSKSTVNPEGEAIQVNHFERVLISSAPRGGKSFYSKLWEDRQKVEKVNAMLEGPRGRWVGEVLEGPKGRPAPLMVGGVDMASGVSKSVTMTIFNAGGSSTFPVKDITWTQCASPGPGLPNTEIRTSFKVTVADNMEWKIPSWGKTPLEPQEENVNYLFEVYVIDLKTQELLGNIPVICCDVPRAVAVAALRLELGEDALGHLKFHVSKVCAVPPWEE